MSERLVVCLTSADQEYQALQGEDARAAGRRFGAEVEVLFAEDNAILQIQQLFAFVHAPEGERPAAPPVHTRVADGLERVARNAARARVGWFLLNRTAPYVHAIRGGTEEILLVQRGQKVIVLLADLVLALDGAVGLQEENPNGAEIIAAAVVVVGCTDGEIDDAVPVQIADRGDPCAKPVAGLEITGEPALVDVDLLITVDEPVAGHEENPHLALIDVDEAVVVVARGADREIGDTIAVEVADAREALAEKIPAVQITVEVAAEPIEAHHVLVRAVVVEKDGPDDPSIRHTFGVKRRPDGDIHVAVVVEKDDPWNLIRVVPA